jgi:O-antigen/teichoic acid export membrane protein
MNVKFSKKISNLLFNIRNKGFFHLLLANFLINFLGFGSQLFVAKFLSATDLGRIKTMQSFISLAVIFAGFGFNTAVLKLCSENKSLDEKRYILIENCKLTFVGVVLTIIIMAMLAFLGYLSPDKEVNHWMLLYMFSIPAAVFTSLFICYVQALKKIQLMSYVQVGIRSLGVLCLIVFTYYWKLPGFILSSVLVGLIALIPLFRLSEIDWKNRPKKIDILRRSIYYGKWSMASNGFNALGISIDILLLNYLVKDRTILGDYGLATIFILAMNQITGTVQAIATPFFSEKSEDGGEFIRVLKKYNRLLIILAGVMSLIAIVVVPLFTKLIYKEKYQMTGAFFQFLVLRYFFWSCYALLGVAMVGLGRMKDNFIASSINVPFAILFTFLFISFWGPIGAAYAQALSGIVAMVIVYLNFNRVLRGHFQSRGF